MVGHNANGPDDGHSGSRDGHGRGDTHGHVRTSAAALSDGMATKRWDGVGEGLGLSVPRRAWRAIILCELNNFETLRRHIGLPRADALLRDIGDGIAALAPGVRFDRSRAIAARDRF